MRKALALLCLLLLAAAAAPLPPETLDEADARLGQPFAPDDMTELSTAEAHWAPAAGWHGDGELVLGADESYPAWRHEFAEDGKLVALRWVIWPYAQIRQQPLDDQRALYRRLAALLLDRYPTDTPGGASEPGEATSAYLLYNADNNRRVTLEWTADEQLRVTVETQPFADAHADRIFDAQMKEAVMEDDGDETFYW